jgi:hypothetical protein
MTVMAMTVHQTFLPHHDPDACLGFDSDTLVFELDTSI